MQLKVLCVRAAHTASRHLPLIAAALIPLSIPAQDALAQSGADLPDAPGFVRMAQAAESTVPPPQESPSRTLPVASSPPATSSPMPEASTSQRYPKPAQPAPILSPSDKVRMAAHGALSPFAATGWIFAAGYEQLTNSPPNWGTDRGAYGERLGDASIRAISEDFLSDGVMAPLLRQDPRYYRLGSGHNTLARVVYAATRPLITRTDHGRTVPNLALMGGNLAGSALTNLYYPQINRGVGETFATFGSGLAGSAVGDGIAEFFGSILFDHHLHHSR